MSVTNTPTQSSGILRYNTREVTSPLCVSFLQTLSFLGSFPQTSPSGAGMLKVWVQSLDHNNPRQSCSLWGEWLEREEPSPGAAATQLHLQFLICVLKSIRLSQKCYFWWICGWLGASLSFSVKQINRRIGWVWEGEMKRWARQWNSIRRSLQKTQAFQWLLTFHCKSSSLKQDYNNSTIWMSQETDSLFTLKREDLKINAVFLASPPESIFSSAWTALAKFDLLH